MKAEERKALLTNDLSKGLETAIDGVTHPPRTAFYWVLGLAAVAAAVLLFYYFLQAAEAASSARWLALDGTPLPEQLALVDKDGALKDTPQGRLLEYKEARLDLAEGVRMLGLNRGPAAERIAKATAKYEELLRSAGRVPLLHQEALWGAAKGNEALGDLTKAKQWYTRLADEYKTSALGQDAKKQLERLENSAADIRELVKELTPEAAARRN